MDPFAEAKREVEKQHDMLKVLHGNWKALLPKVNTSTDDEFTWISKEIDSTLRSLCEDLKDLEEAVQAMLKNPTTFRLTQKEVQLRQQFVKATQGSLNAIATDMASPTNKAKLERDKREMLLESAKRTERQRRTQDAHDQKNQAFIDQNSPQVLVAQQDKEISLLGDTIERLKAIAHNIGTALDQDAKLLGDLEDRVDNSLVKVKAANKKVDKLQKQI